jgi:hypothetical protein
LRGEAKWHYLYFQMRVEKLSKAVFTPLEDGTGVLLNLQTLCYYNLNKTGVAVWVEIDAKPGLTVDEIAASISERFDVEADAALIDARAFIEHLARFKIVRIA